MSTTLIVILFILFLLVRPIATYLLLRKSNQERIEASRELTETIKRYSDESKEILDFIRNAEPVPLPPPEIAKGNDLKVEEYTPSWERS